MAYIKYGGKRYITGYLDSFYGIVDASTEVVDGAIKGLPVITKFKIPDGITDIRMSAFADNSNLTEVIIPDSVTVIGGSSFQNCTALTDVYYPGSQEEWNAITIGPGNEPLTNATIHYNS